MRLLTWTEKQVIQKMILETLERAFSKEITQVIYLACSEAVFREIEDSEWFQDDKPILSEHIEVILGTLISDALKFMFEGEFEK